MILEGAGARNGSDAEDRVQRDDIGKVRSGEGQLRANRTGGEEEGGGLLEEDETGSGSVQEPNVCD